MPTFELVYWKYHSQNLMFMKSKTTFLLLAICLTFQFVHAQCVITLRPGPTDGKDTHVFQMSCSSTYAQQTGLCETTNFGTWTENYINAWSWNGTQGKIRSFMEFDLDSLANIGCTVNSAILRIFPEPGNTQYNCGAASTAHPCDDNSFVVSRVTQPWNELTVNWVNQPPVASTVPLIDYVQHADVSGAYDPSSIDITDMVNFWLTNPTQNHGMRFSFLTESSYRRLAYCSSEHANGLLRPTLTLVLNCPGSCDRMIEGDIYFDANADCVFGSGETPLQNWLVEITPGPTYATTDAAGHWAAWVGTAPTYTINQFIPNHFLWDSICPLPYVRTATGLTSGSVLSGLDFALDADMLCAQPIVDIVGGNLRPCHTSPYAVQYCNNGNDSLLGAYVTVTADPALTFLNSTLAWDIPQLGNVYVFQVGDLGPGDCGSFVIDVQVSCLAVIGQSICVQAEIAPIDSCIFTPIDTLWDGSNISLDGGCMGDTAVCISVFNTGSAMTVPSQYRIFENGVIVYTSTLQLCGGCDTIICWPANGTTIRLEVDQTPGHPGSSFPSITTEGCGEDSLGGFSRGFVTTMTQDDEDDFIEIFCDEVVNSYDPNDKINAPMGTGIAHNTPIGAKLEYTIRFQNTGTASAIDIKLLDTLSQFLDVTSVHAGASSHPYNFRIYGSGILEFTFPGINLPDSNANEPASHGFVKFSVDQKQGIAEGTRIENSAAIYFDNNAPVITPIAFNTIGIATSTTEPWGNLLLKDIKLYPNPAHDRFTVEWPSEKGNATITVMDLAGRKLMSTSAIGGHGTSRYAMDVSALPSAVYFVKIDTGTRHGVIKFVKN